MQFGIECSTVGNFQFYDEKYFILETLTKAKVEEIVNKLNDKIPAKTTLDKNNPKDFNFNIISEEEVWTIVKKYSAGCTSKYIAEYITSKREEQYKKITGKYAEKKLTFPKSRIQDVISLLK